MEILIQKFDFDSQEFVDESSNILLGNTVYKVSIDDKKLDMAKKFGADIVINSKKEDTVKKVIDTTGLGMDIVELTVQSL